ncbi:unnamed protein product [Gongylonema pulchrum]|uniref:Uncharacterized protein n=1 Tax=Gongylonema pulchrum TaxID=637853 RepID=A0A183ENN6_9BILA|nr:unnamed protein product [Gongylonema pulchrum]
MIGGVRDEVNIRELADNNMNDYRICYGVESESDEEQGMNGGVRDEVNICELADNNMNGLLCLFSNSIIAET